LSFEEEGTFTFSESFVENIKYNIEEKKTAIIPYKKKIIKEFRTKSLKRK
jgi:hypothetical protein